MIGHPRQQNQPNSPTWDFLLIWSQGKEVLLPYYYYNRQLTKYVGSRWLIISLVFGLLFFFTLTKFHKEELGQYPTILTSHLVNNTSIYVTYLFYLSFGDHLLHYLFPTLVLIFILNFLSDSTYKGL